MTPSPPPLAEVVLDSLAAHRLTRLITADTITQPLRDRVLAWAWRHRTAEVVHVAYQSGLPDPVPLTPSAMPEGWIQQAMETHALEDPPKLATLVTCRWCAGAYVAGAVVALRAWSPRGWRWAARALSVASAAALWAALEDR